MTMQEFLDHVKQAGYEGETCRFYMRTVANGHPDHPEQTEWVMWAVEYAVGAAHHANLVIDRIILN